jgi:hypothetical protein
MLLLFRTEERFGCNVSHVNTYSGIAEKSMDKFAALISSFRYPGPRASGLHAPLKALVEKKKSIESHKLIFTRAKQYAEEYDAQVRSPLLTCL